MKLVDICDIDQLWDDEMACFLAGDTAVLLIRANGRYHAYQGQCPHQRAALVEGELVGGLLICPVHGWKFDARNGQGVNPKTACLRRFPVHVIEQKIWIELEHDVLEPVPMPSLSTMNGVLRDDA